MITMQNSVLEAHLLNHHDELDILPVSTFIVDNQGVIKYHNIEAGQLLLSGCPLPDNITDLSDCFDKHDYHLAINEHLNKTSRAFEAILDIKQTVHQWYQLKMVTYQKHPGDYLIIVYPFAKMTSNADTLKSNFKDLKQFSRFNAMREISALIADQLNQPLTAILSFTQAMQRLYQINASSEEITDAMERVVINARKAGDLIRDIRSRSQIKTNTLNYTTTSIHQLINECIDFTDLNYFNSRILLKKVFDPSISTQCVDAVQLKQVIISLLNNAIDAVIDNSQPPQIVIQTAINDLYYELSVQDNGPGIPDSIKDKLFEPFISTKKDGIGIGLSMCQHIINLHKGTIKIISNNNPMIKETGTRVIITIPFIRNHSETR